MPSIRPAENPYRNFDQIGTTLLPPNPDYLRLEYDGPDYRQYIYIVRGDHIPNPWHPQYRVLCGGFHHFLQDTAAQPESRTLYCEGRRLNVPGSLVKSITDIGDRAVLERLSTHYDIPLAATPSSKKNDPFISLLRQGFEPNHIMYYLIIRHLAQWQRTGERLIPLEKYLDQVQHRYTQQFAMFSSTGWKDFSLEASHNALFPSITLQDVVDDFFFVLDQTVSLWETDTELQNIAVAWNIEVDNTLFAWFIKLLQEGKSSFGSFGWQHGYALEKRLRRLGKVTIGNDQTRLWGFWNIPDAAMMIDYHSQYP